MYIIQYGSKEKIETITELVNEVFKDYVIPINWTKESFLLDMAENSIFLEHSQILYFGKEKLPIGFCITSAREKRARIDSFGIKNEYRKTGASYFLINNVFYDLSKKGFSSLQLEVESSQTRAVDFYIKNGFKISRNLDSFILPEKTSCYKFNYSLNCERSSIRQDILLKAKRSPNWQREITSVYSSKKDYFMNQIRSENKEIGKMLWGRTEDTTYIVDIYQTDFTVKYSNIIQDAISYLSSFGKPLITVSLPQNDPLNSVLLALGSKIFLQQYEMVLSL
ncbi:MAG TPA: GNAT family N-acetyltransferase [Petrotogaceae bacterium]|nr:GNAT family N-acetyltransferase [Petrotogaceae bacterium]HNV06223.1 GNAT family N-acetyltransferase [Petrotogaceae bacterium]HNY37238.1 GNAT family N-acetyltransferase [Petrotogaceae bacterium]HPA92547.1 GNAT family N-acetyltransferase [Petrotogaceae bacterium]HPO27088.1 GNAT family N-acetyltransferase [Petrotogaceae bacterium]